MLILEKATEIISLMTEFGMVSIGDLLGSALIRFVMFFAELLLG